MFFPPIPKLPWYKIIFRKVLLFFGIKRKYKPFPQYIQMPRVNAIYPKLNNEDFCNIQPMKY